MISKTRQIAASLTENLWPPAQPLRVGLNMATRAEKSKKATGAAVREQQLEWDELLKRVFGESDTECHNSGSQTLVL